MKNTRIAKLTLIGLICLLVAGCSDTLPVPDSAVKECLDKGWNVDYSSSSTGTYFECKRPMQTTPAN